MRAHTLPSRWPSSHLCLNRLYGTKPSPKPSKSNTKPTTSPRRQSITKTKPPTKPASTTNHPSTFTPPTTHPKSSQIISASSLTYALPSTTRVLGYSIYGPPLSTKNIPTILIFHGFPGSRLDAYGLLPPSLHGKVRIIGIDRPGVGLATFQRERRLLDWPDDVVRLMDGLGIDKFSVLGGSVGGMYALACAKRIERSRLKGVGVVSGYVPVESGVDGAGIMGLSPKERFLLRNPSLMTLVMWWRVGRHVKSGNQRVWMDMAREMGFGGSDISGVVESLKEPFRKGVGGYVWDGVVMSADWGFDVREVTGKVRLWYGLEDRNTPVEMGKWLEERLEGGILKTFERENHFTLLANRGEEILKELMADG